MVEQDEHEPDARVARDLERRIKIGEHERVEAGRKAAVVVENAAATVGEEEPPHDGEAERRHAREISGDGLTPRRDAEMRAPDVGAEIESVEDRGPVG